MEDLVLKGENLVSEVTSSKKGKIKQEDDDDDIDTERTLEKTQKEVEKNLKNAEFIEGVNEVSTPYKIMNICPYTTKQSTLFLLPSDSSKRVTNKGNWSKNLVIRSTTKESHVTICSTKSERRTGMPL